MSEQELKRHIILIGPMGAGKSTIGTVLAGRLGLPFVDLDAQIAQRSGKSIPEIFADDGECAFRARESELLAEQCTQTDAKVLATGGGVVLSAPNRERMRRSGTVIWLDAPPEITAERIAGDANRPLLLGVDALARARQLDHERRHWYERTADHRVHTDKLDVTAAADEIAAFLSQGKP